jgi:hypothetical protein
LAEAGAPRGLERFAQPLVFAPQSRQLRAQSSELNETAERGRKDPLHARVIVFPA